jgi:ribosome-associated toxin RatA of RatAB toxin-antitoxin module
MQTENRIIVGAPWLRVFEAAARVEDWPQFLPHYRKVEAGPWDGQRREVRMSASRDGFPCRWTAQQRLERPHKRIHYRHTRSAFTRGMEVWWLLEALGPRETLVRLTHAMPPEPPPLSWFRQQVVGAFFVHAIAQKTLEGVKRHVEGNE